MKATMVCDNRRVVEDFILYKISDFYHDDVTQSCTEENGAVGYSMKVHRYKLPKPQDPPNTINKCVRALCARYEDRYKAIFPDLLDQIRTNHIASDSDVDYILKSIAAELFQIPKSHFKEQSVTSSTPNGRKSRTSSPALSERRKISLNIEDSQVKWTHVMGLFVFASLLAIRYIEIDESEQVDAIVNWVTAFLDTVLSSWLNRQGGWNGFVKWYENSKAGSSNEWWKDYEYSLQNVIKFGAVAALGVGAFIMARK